MFEAKGYVIPASPRQVTPEVSGRILERYVVEGKKVQAGEVLCRLDKEEYQADHDRSDQKAQEDPSVLQLISLLEP